ENRGLPGHSSSNGSADAASPASYDSDQFLVHRTQALLRDSAARLLKPPNTNPLKRLSLMEKNSRFSDISEGRLQHFDPGRRPSFSRLTSALKWDLGWQEECFSYRWLVWK